MSGIQMADICVDCRAVEAALTIRRRRLCRACYTSFVGYKVFKRMERYRLRKGLPKTGQCKLLLPLSYGLSSSVLLHILHKQMEDTLAKAHPVPGFDLHVLIIDPSSLSPLSPAHNGALNVAQNLFPLATFTCLSLHDIFDFDDDLQEVMSNFMGKPIVEDKTLSHKERLQSLRASIASPTSKADVDNILLTRLVVAFAKKLECLGILWGDSDNRLAAKALANVAKGRGSSLTWQVSDGMSPFGLEFNFPLRDLFVVELQDYSELFPELADIIIPDRPPSDNILTKNMSIDELMIRYVQTHGEKYPGVMSNVTRTANKLEASQMTTDGSQCALCSAYVPRAEATHHGIKTINGSEEHSLRQFCYACYRSRPELSC